MDYQNKSRSDVPRFFVAGAAHLDIISVATGTTATLDKTGTLHLDVGGTGFNLANNLRALGGDINLLTALPVSPFTDIILDSLADNGIQVFAKQHASLQLGGFSAHLNSRGEVLSAISACPVELYQFDDAEIDEVLQAATVAIADCNLNPASLARISSRACKAGLPFFVAGVSQEKSLRLEVCLGLGHTFFLNKEELHYFLNNTGRQHLVGSADVLELGRSTWSNWLVSDGANGVSYYSATDTFSLAAPPLSAVLALPGVGDMLLAATVWYLAQSFPLRDAAKRAMLQVTRVAERKNCSLAAVDRIESAMHSLTQATRTDLMTNLQNRRGLEREMESQAMKALARKGLVSVVLLDIDKFKAINDDFGHPAGDAVIAWVASELKLSIREHDVAGRWGGEEFIVLLPGEALEGAALVAERIRTRVQAQSTTPGATPRQITVSLGVACCKPGESFDSVITRADKALYAAKANGRDRVELAEN